MKHLKIKKWLAVVALVFVLGSAYSCRGDIEILISEEIDVDNPNDVGEYKGFYLLNEGNMGMNKATLDFYDFETGNYKRNIYAEYNPDVPKELGDVGNDVAIYGSKLYAVINVSNKVEVMDANTVKRIGHVEIPNCRFIKFHGDYAYVTSYAGPVEIDPNYKQKGFVAKVDTATLQVVDKCIIGYQPDELEIVNGKIYVANSGGYMGAGDNSGYERTVSVIDLNSFKEESRIDVAINLEKVRADKRGNLWVSSRGDHHSESSQLFFIDSKTQEVTDTVSVMVNSMWMDDDLLYVVGNGFSYITGDWTASYSIIDTNTRKVVATQIVTDGTEKEFETPYGIMVHPTTKDIYITDAGDYVTPGVLYCFDKDGKKKWDVRTGDIPAHFALLPKN